jgi:hypothetical protein
LSSHGSLKLEEIEEEGLELGERVEEPKGFIGNWGRKVFVCLFGGFLDDEEEELLAMERWWVEGDGKGEGMVEERGKMAGWSQH